MLNYTKFENVLDGFLQKRAVDREAVCILKGVKPTWDESKKLLNDGQVDSEFIALFSLPTLRPDSCRLLHMINMLHLLQFINMLAGIF